jgi:hypothetical protein
VVQALGVLALALALVLLANRWILKPRRLVPTETAPAGGRSEVSKRPLSSVSPSTSTPAINVYEAEATALCVAGRDPSTEEDQPRAGKAEPELFCLEGICSTDWSLMDYRALRAALVKDLGIEDPYPSVSAAECAPVAASAHANILHARQLHAHMRLLLCAS